MNDLEAFARLINALDPWRADLVLIGGWAHRLHRFHPQAGQLDHQPVSTRDTDLAFDNGQDLSGDIKAALEHQGFIEQMGGSLTPPAAHYVLGDAGGGFYAEFLTPQTSSGRVRQGRSKRDTNTVTKANVTAQKIRELDLLLKESCIITLDPAISMVPVSTSVDLRVADPLCFILQKFLIQDQRQAIKRSQDLLYVFDTLMLFSGQINQFRSRWHQSLKPWLGKKAMTIEQASNTSFEHVTDSIRNAAKIPTDRTIDPEEMQVVCRYALDRIFSE